MSPCSWASRPGWMSWNTPKTTPQPRRPPMRRINYAWTILLAAVGACTAYVPPPPNAPVLAARPLPRDVLVKVFDVSGSYEKEMLGGGKALKAVEGSLRKFTRANAGE